ncbi:MAG: glyoxalase [Blautia sp.]|nr:glyoxalase [Blautia sp.]MDY3999324.1 glyoxalase [Blautia sp.]
MYSKEAVETFLKNQSQLFDEAVADNYEEAEGFLEDCMAAEVNSLKEVKEYLEDSGADLEGMSLDELAEACEVFALPSGRYLIVEA